MSLEHSREPCREGGSCGPVAGGEDTGKGGGRKGGKGKKRGGGGRKGGEREEERRREEEKMACNTIISTIISLHSEWYSICQ